jgi:hypothetical protein
VRRSRMADVLPPSESILACSQRVSFADVVARRGAVRALVAAEGIQLRYMNGGGSGKSVRPRAEDMHLFFFWLSHGLTADGAVGWLPQSGPSGDRPRCDGSHRGKRAPTVTPVRLFRGECKCVCVCLWCGACALGLSPAVPGLTSGARAHRPADHARAHSRHGHLPQWRMCLRRSH